MQEDEKPEPCKEKSQEPAPTTGRIPLGRGGTVVVTHLDAPPPAGKKTIHPRRVPPPVPTREEREAQSGPTPKPADE